jgi:hypothetical protein
MPRIMHQAVAVQLVASMLNRKNVKSLMAGNLLAGFVDVLLTGSWCGRSILVNFADPVLASADLQDLVRGTAGAVCSSSVHR